jgi:hypothetical protein
VQLQDTETIDFCQSACLSCGQEYTHTSPLGSIRARYCPICFDRLAHPPPVPSPSTVIPPGVGPVRFTGPLPFRKAWDDAGDVQPLPDAWERAKWERSGFTEEETARFGGPVGVRAVGLPTGEATAAAAAPLTYAHNTNSVGGGANSKRPYSPVSPFYWANKYSATRAQGGACFTLTLQKAVQDKEHVCGERGDITAFSAGSRHRLLVKLNSIDRERMPAGNVAFVTVTYHLDWAGGFQRWKRDLDKLVKWHERHYGPVPLVWKLEYQQRGAPHFHLLILWPDGPPEDMPAYNQTCGTAWAKIVAGRGAVPDDDHCKHGYFSEVARSWGGVGSYVSKYMSKDTVCATDGLTGEVMPPGRWWGVRRWKPEGGVPGVPVTLHTEEITGAQFVAMRRVVQKLAERREVERLKRARRGEKWREVRSAQGKLKFARLSRRGADVRSLTSFLTDSESIRLMAWAAHAFAKRDVDYIPLDFSQGLKLEQVQQRETAGEREFRRLEENARSVQQNNQWREQEKCWRRDYGGGLRDELGTNGELRAVAEVAAVRQLPEVDLGISELLDGAGVPGALSGLGL